MLTISPIQCLSYANFGVSTYIIMATTNDEKRELEHGELEKNQLDLSSSIVYDSVETKRILRKIDKRLLPVLTLLYLLSFLDRGNSKQPQ